MTRSWSRGAIRAPHSAAPGARFGIAGDDALRQLVTLRAPSFVADAAAHPLLPVGVERRIVRRSESALRVPIGVGPTADKILILTWAGTRPAPDKARLALVQRFADNAGTALALAAARDLQAETRRLYERLESSLMPVQTVDHPLVSVATRYRSGARGLRIGGDFIGVAQHRDGRVAVVTGDVSGHGPDAAALGATLRGSWRALALADVGWQTMLETLASVLVRERLGDDFVTLCAALVAADGRSAEIVNVAHPPPLLMSKGDPGTVLVVDAAPYPPLGAFDVLHWRPTTIALPPGGWQLLLYTDGLSEAIVSQDARERLGEEGLTAAIAARLDGALLDEARLDTVLADIEARAGGPLADDVAIVMITGRGTPAA